MAKIFSRKFEVDYDETFALVVFYSAIKMFLVIVMYKNFSRRHYGIKIASLHADLQESFYTHQPSKRKKMLTSTYLNLKSNCSLPGLWFIVSQYCYSCHLKSHSNLQNMESIG